MDRDAPLLLPPDVLVSLAREHLGGVADLYVAPDIPDRKLRGAREAHAAALGAGEPIVVLYDATFLGSGEVGLVATPSRFCWRNHFDHPRSLPWGDLAALDLALQGSDVALGGGAITAPVTRAAAERVLAFLEACRRVQAAGAAPYREAGRRRGPATFAEIVVAAARRALGEVDWVHYAPSIPPRMARAVRVVHGARLPPDVPILVLYDDTVLGSGNDGLVMTEPRLCWRNFWGAAEATAWTDVDPERLATDGDLLLLDGEPGDERRRIDLRMRPGMAHLVAAALREIARAARAGRGAAGPR